MHDMGTAFLRACSDVCRSSSIFIRTPMRSRLVHAFRAAREAAESVPCGRFLRRRIARCRLRIHGRDRLLRLIPIDHGRDILITQRK